MRSILVTDAATNDLLTALKFSLRRFGARACERYHALIMQSFDDLAEDATRPVVIPRNDLHQGIYFYHIKHSRKSVTQKSERVMQPRHFVAFRLPSGLEIQILRVVYDRSKFERLKYVEDN